MLVFQFGREGKAVSFDDGCMIQLVPDNIVFTSCQAGYYTQVYLKSRRINNGIFFSDKFGQTFFQLNVQIQRSVQEA